MAVGDITAKITAIDIDRVNLLVTWTGFRYQEDSDGSKNIVESGVVSQTYPTVGNLASQTVLQLYNTGVTLLRAAYPKMPSTVS